jgi:hypothetical protein
MSQDFTDLIGMTYETARQAATGRGIRVLRISSRGGRAMVVTRDYRTDRLNIDMDANERICAIRGIG